MTYIKQVLVYLSFTTFSLATFSTFANDYPKSIKASAIAGSQNTIVSNMVMQKVYEKMGIELIVIELPGKTSIERSNAGVTDAELFRLDNIQKQYPNLVKVPVPINELNGIVFATDNTIKIENWESLRGLRIGIQRGILFTANGTKGMNPLVVDSIEQMFKMLESERLDVIVVAELNSKKVLADFQTDKIVELTPVIQHYDLFHYLHKDHENLLEPITKILTQMQENGEIHKIRQDYIQSF